MFVKVDVEGFEFEAVKGALETLQLHKPLIQIECKPNVMAPESMARLFKSLSGIGYYSFCEGEFLPDFHREVFFIHKEKVGTLTEANKWLSKFEFPVE